MIEAALIVVGIAVGACVVLLVMTFRVRREAVSQDRLIEEVKTAFAALSRDALSQNADDFLKLAKSSLEAQTAGGAQILEEKKKLIDARVEEINARLTRLNDLIQNIERQRASADGILKGQLEKHAQATQRLHETTAQLREALANPQRRGQWGERMAEDVLRLAGFTANVNYLKQQQSADGRRPDYTFLLPGGRRLNMDVKFPLANYLRMLEAADESVQATSASQFLRDVRSRIREVTTRDYIDPAGGTVDYVLVFIPNEHVYAFIQEQDATLLDDAIRQKVVLCSPVTLYAMLAVIRQAAEHFRIEQNAREVLSLLGEFKKQWGKYVETMEDMGRRLEAALEKYRDLTGVRTRQLDRQLDKIEGLQAATGEEPAESIEPPQHRPLPDSEVRS